MTKMNNKKNYLSVIEDWSNSDIEKIESLGFEFQINYKNYTKLTSEEEFYELYKKFLHTSVQFKGFELYKK